MERGKEARARMYYVVLCDVLCRISAVSAGMGGMGGMGGWAVR